MKARTLVMIMFPLVMPLVSAAQIPRTLSYQGVLADSLGNPKPDGAYTFTFRLYPSLSGGSALWTEQKSLQVKRGLFQTNLGDQVVFGSSLTFAQPYWMGIQVASEPELSPRIPLTSVGYSFSSIKADTARYALSAPLQSAVDSARIAGTVANNAITSQKIADSTITGADMSPSAALNIASLTTSGNVTLPATTATSGIIYSGGYTLIHSFGSYNFFAGENAGNLSMTGGYNTTIGDSALQFNTTGERNTASGYAALFSNTTGNYNTASGWKALSTNTTGSENTAHGYAALSVNTTGERNTASGVLALWHNTTGNSNTASGNQALANNTTGDSNTASGYFALHDNMSGLQNTANGVRALSSNGGGSNNEASGFEALYNNSTGSQSTASGSYALHSNTTGSGNTALGSFADVSSGNLVNATAIGYNAIVNASNKIRLGSANVTVIEGNVAYTFPSDSTKKENHRRIDGEEALEKIRMMRLGSWNYKGQDAGKFRHYGPMAQEFFSAFGHDGFGAIGTDTTICSGDLAGISLIAIQALEKRTQELEETIKEQQKTIDALNAKNEESSDRFAALEGWVKSLSARDQEAESDLAQTHRK